MIWAYVRVRDNDNMRTLTGYRYDFEVKGECWIKLNAWADFEALCRYATRWSHFAHDREKIIFLELLLRYYESISQNEFFIDNYDLYKGFGFYEILDDEKDDQVIFKAQIGDAEYALIKLI